MSLSIEAYGQICSISEHPYGFASSNHPAMHGNDFKAILGDLPFIQGAGNKPRYSQFWVNTDVLNVRSGPGLENNIITQTYFGNLVFAYAKHGEWVSIRPGYSVPSIDVPPQWVNIKYLSANRIKDQVDVEILKSKCSFKSYGESNTQWPENLPNGSKPCGSVYNYLSQQHLLSQKHEYWRVYEVWRNSQSVPENYKSEPCPN